LIHKQYCRLAQQFESDIQSLSLSTADRLIQYVTHLEMLDVCQSQVGERSVNKLLQLLVCIVSETQFAGVVQIFEDGEVFHEKVILWDIADDTLHRVRILVNINAVDKNPPT